MNCPLLVSSAASAPALPSLRPSPDVHRIRLSDPAQRVVTDFTRERAITVGEDRGIDDALDDMFRFGVRALLAVPEQRGASRIPITGLITSYDIQGERAQQFLQRSHARWREDIRVGDIMTPWEHVPVIAWSTLGAARVGHLVEIFHALRATHLVVVDAQAGGVLVVRGLISRMRIERQLGDVHGLPPHAIE